jgi:hypothetical protein
MEAVSGSGDVIFEHVDDDQRYRIVKTDRGYLITARGRDLTGLVISAEWLHRTEGAARSGVAVLIAGNVAFRAIQHGLPSNALLKRFGELTDVHDEICARFDDHPLIGEETRA